MRSIWSGAISFGLIYIPVKLFSGSEAQQLDFDMLRKGDLCPIRYVRVCESDGEEVEYKDIVKGYQFRKGDYVVVTDEDFKKAAPKKTQTIEIVAFIKESEVDAKLLEKPYFLEPVKGAARAYALLARGAEEDRQGRGGQVRAAHARAHVPAAGGRRHDRPAADALGERGAQPGRARAAAGGRSAEERTRHGGPPGRPADRDL